MTGPFGGTSHKGTAQRRSWSKSLRRRTLLSMWLPGTRVRPSASAGRLSGRQVLSLWRDVRAHSLARLLTAADRSLVSSMEVPPAEGATWIPFM